METGAKRNCVNTAEATWFGYGKERSMYALRFTRKFLRFTFLLVWKVSEAVINSSEKNVLYECIIQTSYRV